MGGQSGPLPTPASLHLLRGNPGHKSLAKLLDDVVRPDVEIPEMPAVLGAEAADEWHRIGPHLWRLGLVSQLDRSALAAYCYHWGEFSWAQGRIAQMNAADPTGESGRIWNTPSGYKQISVLQQISNRALDGMEKALSHFGMSPASRGRVTPGDTRQPELPGMDPKPAEDGWATFKS